MKDARIRGWFTEGFGTPDLKAAKALLESLLDPPPRFAKGPGRK